MFKRAMSILVIGLGLILNQSGFANEFQEGVHYQHWQNHCNIDPEKIEVVELFWYGCPHCDSLDPALKVWVNRLPADVTFVQIPVVFGRSWEMHARMFWVAKNIGLLETIHEPLFNAIHREGQRLQRVDDIVAFFERFGADPAIVKRELGSFATKRFAACGRSHQSLWNPRSSRLRGGWSSCDGNSAGGGRGYLICWMS